MYVRAALGAGLLAAAGIMVAAVPSAAAAPTGTGCPPAWTLRSVESLAATGNAPVPGQVDEAGNDDGYVCAHPLPDATCISFIVTLDPSACPVETIYLFLDNRLAH